MYAHLRFGSLPIGVDVLPVKGSVKGGRVSQISLRSNYFTPIRLARKAEPSFLREVALFKTCRLVPYVKA